MTEAEGTAIWRMVRTVTMRHRRLVVQSVYAILAFASIGLAYLVRFDFRIPEGDLGTLKLAGPIVIVVRSLVSLAMRLVVARWRYVGTEDLLRLGSSTIIGSIVLLAINMALPFTPTIPRSVLLLEAVFWAFTVAGSWISYRLIFERSRKGAERDSNEIRSLIVGAGTAGSSLAHEIAHDSSGRSVVGLVDDDRFLWGIRIRGVEVTGPTADLADLVELHDADEIIIAIPSAAPATLRRFVQACRSCHVRLLILRDGQHLHSGDWSANQLREVQIEDLLGRDPIVLELPGLASVIRGTCVLITGAAGSIGSELARQIAIHQPAQLLLYDRAESELYFLELELREHFADLSIVPIIGDILDTSRFEGVLRDYHVDTVYHAAAYKHVPLMETNVREAVRNNVIGTWRVADLCGQCHVGKVGGADRLCLRDHLHLDRLLGHSLRQRDRQPRQCHPDFQEANGCWYTAHADS